VIAVWKSSEYKQLFAEFPEPKAPPSQT